MREVFSLGKSEVHIETGNTIEKLYIELTNRCNLSCKMCFRMNFNDPIGMMSKTTLNNLVHSIDALENLRSVLIGGAGEPLLHTELRPLVRSLKEKPIQLSIQTNGILLREHMEFFLSSGVDRIIISYEPGELGHTEVLSVYDLVERLIRDRDQRRLGKPLISLESVITEGCGESLNSVVERFLEIGVNELILTNLLPVREQYKSKALFLERHGERLLERIVNTARGRAHLLLPYMSLRTERHCSFVESNATVIRHDGKVSPCLRFLHSGVEHILERPQEIPAYSFGSINERELSLIWNSRDYLWFRYSVSHSQYPSCIDCSFNHGCAYVASASTDCWGNVPSCGNCLWSRNIVVCP